MGRKSIHQLNLLALDRRESFYNDIKSTHLSDKFSRYIEQYRKAGGRRSYFFWQWVSALLHARRPGFVLSSAPLERTDKTAFIKLLLLMVVTITDDIADRYKDKVMLDIMLKLPFEGEPGQETPLPSAIRQKERMQIRLLERLIAHSFSLLEETMQWKDYREIFMFDLAQVYNSFHYAYLLNSHPHICNYEENIKYGSYNMMFFIFAGIDILFSPGFDWDDLSALREIVLKGQEMARIANWLGTWEREVMEKDLSSGVISLSLCHHEIKWQDILSPEKSRRPEAVIQQIKKSGLEEQLMTEWETLRALLLSKRETVSSVSIEEYIDGLELVMMAHLASKGRV